MKRTKIVCTLGPACDDRSVFEQMVKNGLNVARLNFSHGTHEEHLKRMEMIKSVRKDLGMSVSILLDTKGPEIRTGNFSTPEVHLKEGQMFTLLCDLSCKECLGDEHRSYVSYEGLYKDVKSGDRILIDDGLVALEVKEVKDKNIITEVKNGGVIKNHKGINVPSVGIRLPAMTSKDESDIIFGIQNGVDFIAASFIRKADDVRVIRNILEKNGGEDIHIISKIENQEGLDNLEEILEVSDGLMVARGDLGVEIPTERIPIAQKHMIRRCNELGKPVITATQMLDSMIRNPRPTRAETTDVANAILDGTDAVMLSGETAAGKYPLEAVKTMSLISQTAEELIDSKRTISNMKKIQTDDSVTYAVSHATVSTSADLDASAILVATSSGFTARKISRFRPKAPIIAAVSSDKVMRKLSLVWGVSAVKIGNLNSTDEIFETSINAAKEVGLLKNGDLVVMSAGVPVGVSGATNLMKVHLVGEILIKGTGIGKELYSGKVRIVGTNYHDIEFNDGDILVTQSTDRDMMHLIEKAGAMVVEESGYTSHAAIVALSLNKPTVVGAKNVLSQLQDGMQLTVDSQKGIVYAGMSRIL